MARFTVTYTILAADIEEARRKAFDICVEQTVEFPFDLITDEFIKAEIVGQIESLTETESDRFSAVISYHEDTAGLEFTQFLNVVFGNTSIKPGIRVESIMPTPAQLTVFSGPRFGVDGLRQLIGVYGRPLLSSALKPLGLSARALAEMAYRLTLGGIDIIKDDHGLADQQFAPFEERIARCVEAVQKANQETGGHCLYLPNVTADAGKTRQRARFAKQAGAGAVIISGALTGFDTLRAVSQDQEVNLPVFFHPALAGCFTVEPTAGFSHYAFYGQLMRLAGADAVIFPNFGGRFSFSRAECAAIADGCASALGKLVQSFPAPGGGMNFDNVKEMIAFYGHNAVFLIGGGLFRHDPDITKSVRDLRTIVEREIHSSPDNSGRF